MRAVIVAAAAVVGLMAVPPLGNAAPVAAPSGIVAQSPDIVPVAGGCGPGWHPVGGFRNQWGRWVPRRCVRNW